MIFQADIKKKLSDFTLDIKLTAEDGMTGILGASGCGKSMTLKCIAGIETPDSGRIILDGRVLFDSAKKINLSSRSRGVGYLFQNYALFPNMTVLENIKAGITSPKARREEKARGYLSAFCLGGMEDKYPAHLSGGQQQRVALARLLASDPKMILLDEPFSALDSHLKWRLERELSGAMKLFNGPCLLVSHNRDEVYRMCEQIAVLSAGRVDRVAEKKELFRNPDTLNAALLTGCKNISAAARIGDYTVYAEDWGMELRTNRQVPHDITHIGLRRHYICYAARAKLSGGDNIEEVEVISEIENPFSYLVLLRADGAADGIAGELQWEVGKSTWKKIRSKRVNIVLPGDRLLLLNSGGGITDE